jgi:tetratricopeptide (TPR) repeat protein
LHTTTEFHRRQVLGWLGWSVLLAVAWLAYSPGLSGGFLFDDFVNLTALGASGAVDDAQTFWRYITSGNADPTGRPLALLSFLLDARDWPADPAPFLRTNLLLHLINGSLLFALLRMLGRQLNPDDARNDATALLGAGLWLLHPLFVSTTLYVVQREAMLPASLILLGLLAFSRGRIRFARTQGADGLAWMIAGLVLGTALATLCKANGILLPLLAWVLEATIFQAGQDTINEPRARKRLGRFKAALLILPNLALLLYLGRFLLQWSAPLSMRPWTIGQRALTEARVLLDYLNLLAVPRSVSTGLYNDDYLVSQNLWSPAGTLPALLLLLCLIGIGIYWRRRAPTLSAAVLFYFGGHVLESTVIPLELYFEHRNYLPALLLFWPLSRALIYANRPRVFRIAVAVGLLALCAVTTYQRAWIWGHPEQLAKLWASRRPDSSRAQTTAAASDIGRGEPERALARLLPLWRQHPNDLQLALNYINAACATQGLTPEDTTQLAATLRHVETGTLLARQWLEDALYTASANRCQGLTLTTVEMWLDAAQENPAINTPSAREKSMAALAGLLALEKNEPDKALDYFNRSLAANVSPEVAAGQTAVLAASGHYRHALTHLDNYEKMPKPNRDLVYKMSYLHERVLDWQGYWPRELAILRSKLELEIAAENHAAERTP